MARKVVKNLELITMIKKRNRLLKDNFSVQGRKLKEFFDLHNLEYLDIDDDANPFKSFAYGFYVDSIDAVEKVYIDLLKINNVEGSKYNLDKTMLTNSFLDNELYNSEEAGYIISTDLGYSFDRDKSRGFMNRNGGDCVSLKCERETYYIKSQIDEIHSELENLYVARDALAIVNEKLGLDIHYRTFTSILANEGFVAEMSSPFRKDWFFVEKSKIKELINYFESRERYMKATTAYGKYTVFKSTVANINKDIPKTLSYLDSYSLIKSNNFRGRSNTNLYYTFKNLYIYLSEGMHKEIEDLTNEELELLINYIGERKPSLVAEFKKFYNFTMKNINKSDKVLPSVRKKTKEIPGYELELYFSVIAEIMNKLCNKEFIDTLIDDWSLSSLTLYIYTHYISVWRRADIVEEIPKPNLKLIGFDNGESFKKWLKEGNTFTENMGKIICKDIETKIYAFRETASKNKSELLLYVSEYMHYTYGLLLCICEANRQTNTNVKSDTTVLIAKGAVKTVRQRELLPKILNKQSISALEGSFENRRANKSFESYVAKKSEEWNIGVGYIMASIFRGHKLNESLISEVTKTYINKDVNESSVRAFNMGVLSGVKYRLLEAIGVKITDEDKNLIDNKVSAISLTPYQTELTLKNLSYNSEIIDNFFNLILSEGRDKVKRTLGELLYGKKSYGKHVYTKCLYRAYMSSKQDNIEFTGNYTNPCINANNDGCLGCPFLLAERYFLYELSNKLKEAVSYLENAKSNIDKNIHFNRLLEFYMPLIQEAYNELGMDYVDSIVDVDYMMTVVNKVQKEIE